MKREYIMTTLNERDHEFLDLIAGLMVENKKIDFSAENIRAMLDSVHASVINQCLNDPETQIKVAKMMAARVFLKANTTGLKIQAENKFNSVLNN